MSMAAYGAMAAKSKNARAPAACRISATSRTGVRTPETFDAAENAPMRSREAYSSLEAFRRRSSRSRVPRGNSSISTTSAKHSRQDTSFEWCS